MLTMPPGPDIAPYHNRQIAILDRADWAAWLDPSISAMVGSLRLLRESYGLGI
jgi:putative SOS response-associated peptidase YedK